MSVRVVDMLNTGSGEYQDLGYVETIAVCAMSTDAGSEEHNVYMGVEEFISHESELTMSGSRRLYINELSHNGHFILDYLSNDSKFQYTKNKVLDSVGEYTAVISNGEIFQIKLLIKESPKYYLNIYDLNKTVPLKNNQLNEGFGVDIKQYDEDNIRSKANLDLLINNTAEYVKVMKYMMLLDLDGVTLSSKSFSHLKKSVKHYDKFYAPTAPEEYDFIHDGYFPGYNYINPEYVGKDLGNVVAADINSMFPSLLRNAELPYGKGVWYDGEYKSDLFFPLYIQKIRIQSAIIKDGKTPMMNPYDGIKKSQEKYFEEIEEVVELTLSSVMLELFLDSYDVYGIEYIGGYKYSSNRGSFQEFVDKWMNVKEAADRKGDVAVRTISKMVMNYSYGGFGKRRKRMTSILTEDGPEYVEVEMSNRYLPVAIFITSYAIKQLVDVVNEAGDKFVYCDVDSIHVKGDELPKSIEIHESELGKWKIEGYYTRAKFLKLKTYIEENDKEVVIKTSGAGDEIKSQMNYDNFNYGVEFNGLLRSTAVKGGSVREESVYRL